MKTTESEAMKEWNANRKCMARNCRRPVQMVSPGHAEIRLTGPGVDLPLIPASPEINLCLHHAQKIGWPWPSEKARRERLRCSP